MQRIAIVFAFITSATIPPLNSCAENSRASRLSVYIHLDQCFDHHLPLAQRDDALKDAVASMSAAGIEAIVPFVSTTSGRPHYPSEFLSDRIWEQWDPVRVLVDSARQHGMKVVLAVPALMSGHARPEGVLKENPTWALRDVEGQTIGSISPGHPDARQWVVGWLQELVERYSPDGLLLDYLRFAGQQTQLDPISQSALNSVLDETTDSDRKLVTHRYRQQLLTELMQQISQGVREIKPDVRIAVYSWGYHVTEQHPLAQDWPTWAARGYIDEVNISGYWYSDTFSKRFGNTHFEAFQNATRGAKAKLVQAGDDTDLTFALGVKTSHGSLKSSEEIETYLRLASVLDVDGTTIFTWSYLKPFLPELVASGVLDRFLKPQPRRQPSGGHVLVATANSSQSAQSSATFLGDGNGDQEQINAAIAALPSTGGTVALAEGTYDIRKVDGLLGGVVIGRSNIVLAGSGPSTRLIQAPMQNSNVIRIIGSGVHHVTIRDLVVDANRNENDQGKGDPDISHDRFEFCGIKGYCRDPRGPSAEDLHDIVIRNCEVRNAHRLGIMLEGSNLQVINNVLGNAGSDAVELLTGPGMIRGNYVEITEPTHVAIGSDRGNSIHMSENTVHVKPGGDLDIGFRSWADSQRHVIANNVVIIDQGGHCELAMDLRGQMQTVTGNIVEGSGADHKVKVRVGGGNTILSGNLLKHVTVEILDTYEDQKPIIVTTNVLDNSEIEHVSGNLQTP